MALNEILARKHLDVAAREKETPLSTFRNNLVPSDRPFFSPFQPISHFILEAKKSSPSKDLIRPDFDIEAIAKIYAPFAAAISVLTDEPFFQGSLNYLSQVRALVQCPVLCKDFVISPYQVYEARKYGADAILLMLSVLDDATYLSCRAAAAELSIDILTEVHDESELDRALKLNAPIIGINNRNLTTLEVDLTTTKRLASSISPFKKGGRGILIAESGFSTHRQIVDHRDIVDAFLVGTSLMSQPRLDIALRELIFGRIKICGLTRVQDAQAAYNSGASFGGLIFAKESPRVVDIARAKSLSQAVPLRWVGVFINESSAAVANIAKELDLFAVQLHGEESAAYGDELRGYLPEGTEIWKAVRIKQSVDPRQIVALKSSGFDRILLDAYSPEERGGTGQSFDWSHIDEFGNKDRIILSGGLSPDNISEADKLGMWALDVNSQVESAPGQKDVVLIESLFSSVRQ